MTSPSVMTLQTMNLQVYLNMKSKFQPEEIWKYDKGGGMKILKLEA